MKTVRDIVSKLEMDATFHKQHSNILIDQALKELEEVILESLPEKKKKNGNTLVQPQFSAEEEIRKDGYNLALEDTRKVIKDLMK